jgi:hypothetical protein
MRVFRIAAAAVVLALAPVSAASPAGAAMTNGNYNLLTDRYDLTSWVWFVTPCLPDKSTDCVNVSANPRLTRYYANYEGRATLVDGRYTLTIDVPDGLRCPGYNVPTRDTYTWDQNTLAGDIVSNYDVGCFNGPPGQQHWTFALQRL